MSFPTITKPIKSPSLDEFDLPTFEDDQDNVLEILAVVQPDADGVTGLDPDNVTAVANSQVTGKRQSAQVGTNKVPVKALMQINPSTGALEPFQSAEAAHAATADEATHATSADTATSATTAASATTAVSVSGKFQSGVRTATGSQESIAHGLGTAPTLVLISIYDTNGVALPIAMAEGAHTTTNLLITVTANVKYKVIAFK